MWLTSRKFADWTEKRDFLPPEATRGKAIMRQPHQGLCMDSIMQLGPGLDKVSRVALSVWPFVAMLFPHLLY